MKQLAFDFVPPARPTLENFIAGRNDEALQRLRSLHGAPAGERSIYLWGAPGSGRSHLLRGAIESLTRLGARAAYVETGRDLQALDFGAIDAAAVDDVERFDEPAQHALFVLFNRLRENGGTLLAAGDAPPARLSLRADVVTRLGWGLIYEVHPLTDADKAQALCEHAAARGFALPPALAQYLLNHVRRDLTVLLALVESLDRYSMETKRSVSLPLLKDLLSMKADR